jgi:hypothetical protein
MDLNGMSKKVDQISKIIIIVWNTNIVDVQLRAYNSDILRTDCIKDLGVFLDSAFFFHQDVDYFLMP